MKIIKRILTNGVNYRAVIDEGNIIATCFQMSINAIITDVNHAIFEPSVSGYLNGLPICALKLEGWLVDA